MSIEIVDPGAIEKEPKAGPKTETDSPETPRKSAKRLVEIHAKLDRALTRLDQQIDTLHGLNARLFGAGKATSENQKDDGNGRNNGVVSGLDDKAAHFDALLEKLDEEVRAIDTLA